MERKIALTASTVRYSFTPLLFRLLPRDWNSRNEAYGLVWRYDRAYLKDSKYYLKKYPKPRLAANEIMETRDKFDSMDVGSDAPKAEAESAREGGTRQHEHIDNPHQLIDA